MKYKDQLVLTGKINDVGAIQGPIFPTVTGWESELQGGINPQHGLKPAQILHKQE
jgi:hypothetical protein